MRVGLLGNMNNNHFAISRYLRDRGVEAEVLLFEDEYDHFHPAADSFDLSYMTYCRSVNWGSPLRFLSTSAAAVKADLAPYDVLIGAGTAPAFCHKAGRRLDIFVPYGGDLFYLTRYQLNGPERIPSIWSTVHHMRKGLADVRVVHMDYTNDRLEVPLEKFAGHATRWLCGLPVVHTGTYAKDRLAAAEARTHWGHEFRAIRNQFEFVVFSGSRHLFPGRRTQEGYDKGTDKLLHGWALFRQRHPNLKAALVTLEYGPDVFASRQLIRELGVEDSVRWLPKMTRKDLMVGLSLADVACSEFTFSWLCGGVMYEALVAEKPILGFREDAAFLKHYPELYPIMNANDAQGICRRLEEFILDPAAHRALGRQGRAWYDKFVVEEAMRQYMAYIQAGAHDKRPTGV